MLSQRIASQQSLNESFHSTTDYDNSGMNFRKQFGIPVLVRSNQKYLIVKVKQELIKQLQDEKDFKLTIDINYFRYVADQTFVNSRKLANGGGNDASFKCALQNGFGPYNEEGLQTQIMGVCDITYSYVDDGQTKYVYEFISKMGQFIEIRQTYQLNLAFASTDGKGNKIGSDVDFGVTNYHLSLFIE